MWSTVVIALAVGWSVVATVILVVVFVRRVRANGHPKWPEPESLPTMYPRAPRTPLPEWVNWDDDDPPDRPATAGRVIRVSLMWSVLR